MEEDDESDNEHDIYDTDEDDQLAGDEEESSGETTTTTGRASNATSPNQNALARFERILRPRIGLNISYARFDRFDNQLRLLIGFKHAFFVLVVCGEKN